MVGGKKCTAFDRGGDGCGLLGETWMTQRPLQNYYTENIRTVQA